MTDGACADGSDRPTLTFEDSAKGVILEPFGWEVDDGGWIVDGRDGQRVVATDGEYLRKEEFAGVVEKHGRTYPLRGDFVSLCNYVSDRSQNTAGENDE